MKIEIPQIDPSLWLRLTIEAKHRGQDTSVLVQEALRLFLGMSPAKPTIAKKSKLDQLAGTWSQAEEGEFTRNTEEFGKIDPEMWQ